MCPLCPSSEEFERQGEAVAARRGVAARQGASITMGVPAWIGENHNCGEQWTYKSPYGPHNALRSALVRSVRGTAAQHLKVLLKSQPRATFSRVRRSAAAGTWYLCREAYFVHTHVDMLSMLCCCCVVVHVTRCRCLHTSLRSRANSSQRARRRRRLARRSGDP